MAFVTMALWQDPNPTVVVNVAHIVTMRHLATKDGDRPATLVTLSTGQDLEVLGTLSMVRATVVQAIL